MRNIILLILIIFNLSYSNTNLSILDIDSIYNIKIPPMDTMLIDDFPPITIEPSSAINYNDSTYLFDSGAIIISERTAYKAKYYKLSNQALKASNGAIITLYKDCVNQYNEMEKIYQDSINNLNKLNKQTFLEKNGLQLGFFGGILSTLLIMIFINKVTL